MSFGPTPERSFVIETNGSQTAWPVTFSTNGEYLLSADGEKVRVWRVENSEEIATMEAKDARCLAVSKDGRWIAAGAYSWVIVWDTETFQPAFTLKNNDDVRGVDFAPDSTRLVAASSAAIVWNFATGQQLLRPLCQHSGLVRAAKYSLQGDRIATATWKSVQIYDSGSGNLLVHLDVGVIPWYNTGLAWSNQHLFIASDSSIQQVEPSTGSTVSKWPVPESTNHACIALPNHGEYIAYSTNETVSLWDTSTHERRGLIQLSEDICSIAFSSNDQSLAVGGEDGRIAINGLQGVQDLSYCTVPFIEIDGDVFGSWKQGGPTEVEASLTSMIEKDRNTSHHTFATRALVRANLQHWDLAIDDAEESIKIQPSVIGYIAKSVALIGSAKKDEVCQVYDLAFMHCHPSSVKYLLLIKAVVLFMVGARHEAISRIGALAGTLRNTSICYVVQAYMCLFLGNSCLESNDYEGALEWFQCARVRVQNRASRLLSVISMISGWNLDDIGVTIQQRHCETLHAAGRTTETIDCLLRFVNAFEGGGSMSDSVVKWVSDFTRKCLTGSDRDGGATSKENLVDEAYRLLLSPWANTTLARNSWRHALETAVSFTVPRFTIYQIVCERLETIDQVKNAIDCLKEMVSEQADNTDMRDEESKWILGFMRCCTAKLVHLGDVAAEDQRQDDAIAEYSAALSLNPSIPHDILVKRSKAYLAKKMWQNALDDLNRASMHDPTLPRCSVGVLREWAKVTLTSVGWKETLNNASKFKGPRFAIYQSLCEDFEAADNLDVIECFHAMENELLKDKQEEQLKLILDSFKSRCCTILENRGDAAMTEGRHLTAILQYSAALELHPTVPQALFIKRNKAHAAQGLWNDASRDADEVIKLDPSSPLGYEMKHAALRAARRYVDAAKALERMLSMMLQSSDPEISERAFRYVHPSQMKDAIRNAIENVIHEIPLVLINTDSGRLLDKSGQASLFEKQPIFWELMSSLTSDIDHPHIAREVAQYYRYAMFSHKWEEHEPLFENVIHVVVYDLQESRTHNKLKMFCKIAQDAGFHWAWSDTCCINKANHFVLQEALVAMFKWYAGSALTVVLLLGVRSPSQRGDLVKSIWNTRAWTFQEYHASKVVRFYNEDWTLYMNLDIYNHKESLEIISEMEEVTGISAQALMAIRPGLDDVREKLRLASTRQTTRIEDSAYSLLGMFSTSLPVVYGEGDKALGRLLAQLLTSSGDTSILAWSGRSGSFNSCLPANIFAFYQPQTTHIPPAIQGGEMDTITAGLRTSPIDFTLVMELYDRLHDLPVPSFAGQRLRLPCIVFKLGPVMVPRTRSRRVFRAQTAALGIVEITTEEDISLLGSLYLVHPWVDFLLDRQPVGSTWSTPGGGPLSIPESSSFAGTFDNTMIQQANRVQRMSVATVYSSLRPPSTLLQIEKETQALQVIVRLRQPFGALLLAPNPGNVSAYRRVAAEALITAQVREVTPTILNKLVDSVRILDML